MPRPASLFRPRVRANWTFVNRTQPIETFESSLAVLGPASTELLVFYGVGGQGKTKLCEELLRRLNEREEKALKVAHIDLKKQDALDHRLALIWIRNALAKAGVSSFPAFDLGFALYWQSKNPEQPPPSFEGTAWLHAGEALAGEGVSAGVGAAAQALFEHGLEGVPFVGSALKKLGSWAIKTARKTYTLRTNESVKTLFGPSGELLPTTELESQLASLLAADLEQALTKTPALRFVVLVDEYERALEKGGLTSRLRRSAFDAQVSRFAARAPGTLLTIFSRERLPWSDQPPEGADGASWKAWVDSAHHILGGLSVKDAQAFLAAVPIDDPAVREAMIDGASVGPLTDNTVIYPLMLDLQVDIYLRNVVDGKVSVKAEAFRTAASSFEDLRRQLVQRLLRDYPDAEGALKRLAVASSFNREIFVHLEREFLTGLSAGEFERLSELSFVQEREDGELSMHRIIRDSLVERLGAEDLRATHRSLARFFEARAQLAEDTPLTAAHVSALGEAVYHRLEDDPVSSGRWWLAVRDPYFRRAEVGALVAIEQRLIDAVSERAPDELELRLELVRADVAELVSIGQLSESLELNTLAIELARRLGAPKRTVLLQATLIQAVLLQRAQRFLEAEMLTDEVSDTMTGLDPADLADLEQGVRGVIAQGLASRGLHAKAEVVLRSQLAAAEGRGTPGGDAEMSLSLRLNLMKALIDQNRIAEAEAEAALVEGMVDADTSLSITKQLLAYGSIARFYMSAGVLGAAHRVAAKAVGLFKDSPTPSDPLERGDFLHVRSNLQSLIGAQDAAMRDAEAWLHLIESSAAHGEADLIAPLFAIMRCAAEAGEVKGCEAAMRRIEDTASRVDLAAEQRYELLKARGWLARAKAQKEGDTSGSWQSEARALNAEINRLGGTQFVLQSLQREERDLRGRPGDDDYAHGLVLSTLAEQHLRCLDPQNALEAASAALPILERHLGTQHPALAGVISVLIGANLMQGQIELAAPWEARLGTLIDEAQPPMSWPAKARAYVSRADVPIARTQWSEAADLYELARSCDPDPDPASQASQFFDILIATTVAFSGGTPDARWERFAPLTIATLGERHPLAAAAQRFLCEYLENTKQYERRAEAEVTRATMVHAMFGSDHLNSRRTFVEVAEAWQAAGDYAKAVTWSAKALRAFTIDASTREWWAETLVQLASFKLRRGRVDEAAVDATRVRTDAASGGAASDEAIVNATVLCARVALVRGEEEAGLSLVRELESRAVGLTAGDVLYRLWSRVMLLHALLGRHEGVLRASVETRRLAREVWPEIEWLGAEINLIEAVSAMRARAPLPPGVNVWRLGEWLGTMRGGSLALNDVWLAEHQIRAGAAAEAMGESDLAISFLQEGIDAISRSCGEFHPDLRAAQRSLSRLLTVAATSLS